jgi:glycosyltransferase involved in cell wall biosynthesis
MRVLFVYKFLTMGGVEAVLGVRLNGLSEWGVDSHAWFLFDGPGRVIFKNVADRVHVGSTGYLRQFLQRQSFDLISSFDTEEVFPILSRLRESPPLVIEVHSPYPENLEYLRFLGTLPVAAFFVPSRYQAQVVKRKLDVDVPFRIIPNPLAAAFEIQPMEFSHPPTRPVVAWIGRLDDLKNWKEFIQIAGVLRKRMSNIEFWIVGSSGGEDIGHALYRLAYREGVLDRLKWFRGLPHENMPKLLDAVRTSGGVVVSTSRGESFGMTVAEGMARACAVVVPSEGPFREFVSDGVHGRVYRLGSVKDGASKIETLLDDDGIRSECGKRGRASILDRHSSRSALKILSSELGRIIGG